MFNGMYYGHMVQTILSEFILNCNVKGALQVVWEWELELSEAVCQKALGIFYIHQWFSH